MNRKATIKSLYELYEALELPVSVIDKEAGITVHNLKEVGFKLPYTSPVFSPEYFNFLFVKDGLGRYTIDEQSFTAEPGTIYFTNPSNYRTFEWQQINEVYLITFDEAFLKENVHNDVFNEFSFLLTETVRPKIVTATFFSEVEQLYKQMHAEYRRNSIYKYRIIGSIFTALLLKIKEYFWLDYDPIYEGNRGSQIVKDFKQNLERHYREVSAGAVSRTFRVQDYAELQSLHPHYLSNVIKSKTGKPITTWIADKTVAEAKSLLQNSELPVKEISARLGFSEMAHFSNYFKKHTGQSPASYRKENVRP